MFSSSERLRDISSVGLKTVISELPRTTQTIAITASRNITGKMVDAIGKPVRRILEMGSMEVTTLCCSFVGFESVRSSGDFGYPW